MTNANYAMLPLLNADGYKMPNDESLFRYAELWLKRNHNVQTNTLEELYSMFKDSFGFLQYQTYGDVIVDDDD